MGLLRKAILIGGILYALPSPPVTEIVVDEPSLQLSTLATLSAASETVSDAKSFCGRRPQVCATGFYLYSKAQAKAFYSAKLAYDWANPKAPAPTPLASHSKGTQPPLRLVTINDAKPTNIEDLLRGSAQ